MATPRHLLPKHFYTHTFAYFILNKLSIFKVMSFWKFPPFIGSGSTYNCHPVLLFFFMLLLFNSFCLRENLRSNCCPHQIFDLHLSCVLMLMPSFKNLDWRYIPHWLYWDLYVVNIVGQNETNKNVLYSCKMMFKWVRTKEYRFVNCQKNAFSFHLFWFLNVSLPSNC